jgi:hypothetical protein
MIGQSRCILRGESLDIDPTATPQEDSVELAYSGQHWAIIAGELLHSR